MKKLNVPSFVQVGPVGFFVAQNNCTDVEKSTVRLKLSSRVCLHIHPETHKASGCKHSDHLFTLDHFQTHLFLPSDNAYIKIPALYARFT